MNNNRKGFRLLWLAEGTSPVKQTTLSRRKIILLSVVFAIIAGSFVYATGYFIAGRMTAIAMSEVLDENRELRQHLNRMSERLSEVDLELSQLARDDDRLRILADIPVIDEDVREVGIGGLVSPNIGLGAEDQKVRKLIFDIDKIEREIRLQRASFLEIQRQFGEKEQLIAHTPSIRPVKGGYISSGFGRRRDPFNGRGTHHNGVDISIERGTPITATADGTVVFSKQAPGLGKLIILDHGYGFRTAYGHLDKIIAVKGQTVKRGQKIGEVGNTGRSTAPHLHYEVHVDRKAVDPIDYFFTVNATQLANN